MDHSIQTSFLEKSKRLKNHTSLEISSQPDLWKQSWESLRKQQFELKRFLEPIYSIRDLVVILTGAGSSAFIGVSLQGPFQKNNRVMTRAISTTDLVTHPEFFLQKERPTLLVSFARSGDSPESIAAVNLVNQLCDEVYHLIITCNENGKLAQEKDQKNNMVILLPPGTNDKGLAMTASFTSMLLSGILISMLNQIDHLEKQMTQLIAYGSGILQNDSGNLFVLAKKNFKRVVFLGSGPLFGAARESHLKLQELTNGAIICKHDSFLGFRHGPKAVIDKSTVVFYLFSNNPYARRYEIDLLSEICNQDLGMYSVGVSEHPIEASHCLDLNITLNSGEITIDESFLAVCDVLPAQILGYFKSLALGLDPDNPSSSGVISRVVQGVKIYSY
jgi:tagatose-6-phosphate ketose/aldose isomerase